MYAQKEFSGARNCIGPSLGEFYGHLLSFFFNMFNNKRLGFAILFFIYSFHTSSFFTDYGTFNFLNDPIYFFILTSTLERSLLTFTLTRNSFGSPTSATRHSPFKFEFP